MSSDAENGPRGLSVEDIKCLQLLVAGGSDKSLADEMGWSLNDFEPLLAALFRKLGAGHSSQAVAVAIREGIIDFDPPGLRDA